MSNQTVSLQLIIGLIEEENARKCLEMFREHKELWKSSPGSRKSHQAWPGGYLDHICETIQIANTLYKSLNEIRVLPFAFSDVVLILFLHDLEKPFKYCVFNKPMNKSQREKYRLNLITEYGIKLTKDQQNALKYIEGEGDDYVPGERVMNELGAFCHVCDVVSARIWHNQPRKEQLERNQKKWLWNE